MQGAQSLLLVGDQQQLPPTVKAAAACGLGLDTPLFSRALAMGVRPSLLDTQYRMPEAMAAFPSEAFYGGMLRTAPRRRTRTPAEHTSSPVTFIQCECAPPRPV